jgi:hypothetical protein
MSWSWLSFGVGCVAGALILLLAAVIYARIDPNS